MELAFQYPMFASANDVILEDWNVGDLPTGRDSLKSRLDDIYRNMDPAEQETIANNLGLDIHAEFVDNIPTVTNVEEFAVLYKVRPDDLQIVLWAN